NFSKYRNRIAAAKIIPLSQIQLETDGPYLSPDNERNEPAKIIRGADALGKILGQPLDEIANITTKNATRFYRL
ncbi:MAG: TatD family hydrolase, partial [Candidatus Thorarchaeota archaeon]